MRLLLAFVFISTSLFAELKFYGEVSGGVENGCLSVVEYRGTYNYRDVVFSKKARIDRYVKGALKTAVTLGVSLSNLNLEFETVSFQNKSGGLKFSPFQNDYHLRAFYTYGHFEVGYEHLCVHSVTSDLESDIDGAVKVGGGHNLVYIKAKFEIIIWR